jgi:hypothetical protein
MAEKEQIIKEKLEHSGVWSFSGFYSFAHSWLKDESYGVVEEKYSEKVVGGAREISFDWKASKDLSDYFKIELGIKFDIKDLVEVEIEIDGKKKKSNKGKVSIEIKGLIVKDPNSSWESSNTQRFFRDVYNRFIIPGRVDKFAGIAFSDVQKFKEELKAYLELSGKR